uniref:Ribosomal protein S13 n=1 Tax=Schizocladia ischiensis TaxID=196139 RepID=A0A7S6UA14_9STRA|nr:ribosomal protein S13 [Schizocladia ischiensis]QOW07598.1 ribosomal protein S13 [Schizocladia ischiensis]
MPYILGTSIPKDKILVQGLSLIYGIGLHQSKILCQKAGLAPDARGRDISRKQSLRLETLLEESFFLLGPDLRRFQKDRVRRLRLLKSYRGTRHLGGLPVRGQRTHTNASRPRRGSFLRSQGSHRNAKVYSRSS